MPLALRRWPVSLSIYWTTNHCLFGRSFFGLVVATVFILLSEIKRWNIGRVALFATGLIVAVVISSMPLLTTTPSLPYLFFCRGNCYLCHDPTGHIRVVYFAIARRLRCSIRSGRYDEFECHFHSHCGYGDWAIIIHART
ncbi:undecaprenyl phosphate translocase family protein [Psychrobacter sp. JCM 18900]|uniref:undecaprenyl phosphate translocase family protein n=1 Tax=Psychrobacter sp. JCM 18900 TaxID=1298608 RepID=UPI00351BF1C9